MRRRDVISLFASSVVVPAMLWPRGARTQQRLPVVGFLNGNTPAGAADNMVSFRQGLHETGFVEHVNVGFEFRWAEGHYDRLPALAADLIRTRISVIYAGPTAAALAAKAATTTVPIVFATAGDPVQLGLVTSLNRPGGNVTGVTFYAAQLASKQLELLHEMVPKALTIAVLVNPNAPNAEPQTRELEVAAKALGLRLLVLNVGSESDISTAFAALVAQRADALFVTADAFFLARREPIIALAARHRLPAMYALRDFITA